MNQPELSIVLLGGLTITHHDTVVTGFASRKADALFIYLACNPRPLARDTLAALLWPDNDQQRALANLSVVLSSLRKQLSRYLLTDRYTIAFNTSQAYTLDVAEFKQAIAQARSQQQASGRLTRTAAAQLGTAVSLYHGDFLAGFHLRDAPDFEAWMLLEQEHLRQLALEALADLVEFHLQRHQYPEGIAQAQHMLALDPLREEAHRQLMQLYALNGQRPAALTQFDQCTAVLQAELGVEPDTETQALYAEIMAVQEGGRPPQTARLYSRLPVPPPPSAHNLPALSTTFVGRADELGEIDSWLSGANGRLLTVTGPGGVGKTRLAQQAARAHLGEFADGVWYVSLVALSDVDGLVTAVANALGLSFEDGTPQAQLHNYLRQKELLLILDNFEHLLADDEAVTLLADLLQHAPEVRLIVTSRERLRLQAERLLELTGLPYPPIPTAPPEWQPEESWPSIQLFVERARQVMGDFAPHAAEMTAVRQLCTLLAGIPLALELAATWIRSIPLTELVTELTQNVSALETTLRDVPERHRSLRAVFEYSWQLLTPAERTAFTQLSVFRGGFTHQAALEVAAVSWRTLTGLIDKSLLRLDGDGRYRRHPLLIQFAAERLAAQPTLAAEIRARHARYFARFLHEQEAHLLGGAPEKALGPIREELENIRRAWTWAVEHQVVTLLNQMADAIMQAFDLLGLYLAARDMALTAVHSLSTGHGPHGPEATVAFGRVLGLAGAFQFRLGDYKAAAEFSQRALDTLAPVQPHIAYGHACIYAGAAAFGLGDFNGVVSHWENAAVAYLAAGSTWGEAIALSNLAELMAPLGEKAKALQYADRVQELARSMDNKELLANALKVKAIVAQQNGRYIEAREFGQRALDCHRSIGHQAHTANALAVMAQTALALGDADAACTYLEESISILRRVGNRLYLVIRLVELGEVLLELGELEPARQALAEALHDALDTEAAEIAASALAFLSDWYWQSGEAEEAGRLAAWVLTDESIPVPTREVAQGVLTAVSHALPSDRLQAIQQQAGQLTLPQVCRHVFGEIED